MKAQTTWMTKPSSCPIQTNVVYICISSVLFVACFVPSQNGCGESSPHDCDYVISIPVGLTNVICYALNRYRLEINNVIITTSLTELIILFYVEWRNKLLSNKFQQQLFGQNLPSKLAHCLLFWAIFYHHIAKEYEFFLFESSFNSSKLWEINNDIDSNNSMAVRFFNAWK